VLIPSLFALVGAPRFELTQTGLRYAPTNSLEPFFDSRTVGVHVERPAAIAALEPERPVISLGGVLDERKKLSLRDDRRSEGSY
jgi:hypothetical protein